MTGIETLATSVDTWECDENDHMNVQFYWHKFADAERHFRFHSGLEAAWPKVWRTRHVRYHRELRDSAALVVRSAIVPDGPHGLNVVHRMWESGHGFLAATALDGWDLPPDEAAALLWAARERLGEAGIATMPEEARPRGIATEAVELDRPLPAGGFATMRPHVNAAMLDGDGRLQAGRIVGWGSSAAPHVWAGIGFDQPRLDGGGLGRVAMEMKLSMARESPGVGALLQLVSRYCGVARTTFSLAHDVVDVRGGRRVATLEAVALTMNLETRRAIALPDDVRDRVEALVAGGATVSPQ